MENLNSLLLLFPRGELFDGVVLKANADDLSRVTSLSLSLSTRRDAHLFL